VLRIGGERGPAGVPRLAVPFLAQQRLPKQREQRRIVGVGGERRAELRLGLPRPTQLEQHLTALQRRRPYLVHPYPSWLDCSTHRIG